MSSNHICRNLKIKIASNNILGWVCSLHTGLINRSDHHMTHACQRIVQATKLQIKILLHTFCFRKQSNSMVTRLVSEPPLFEKKYKFEQMSAAVKASRVFVSVSQK